MIDIVQPLKDNTDLSYQRICSSCELPYPSFMRWKSRNGKEVSVLNKPGPKKVLPLELETLENDIRNLRHGRKRSMGAGKLYMKHAASISRRDFQYMVSMARYDVNLEHHRNLRRIDWKSPGVVWAMDDIEPGLIIEGQKLYLHNLQDLASRYKFNPVAGTFAKGETVAENLREKFERFGPPLFLKKDNHGNLNNSEVNNVLEEYFVISLNSPAYYAPYNGGVEKANGEFKRMILSKADPGSHNLKEHIAAYSESAANDLNHNPRECLKGQNSCQVFFNNRHRTKFTIRERRIIYEWIISKTYDIFKCMEYKTRKAYESAWRIAVETWLRMKGFINVSINGKVLPNFSLEVYHN